MSDGQVSAEELVEAIAGGNEAAVAALYDRYGPFLFGLCLRICGDRQLAEEAVQDTFVDVWRAAASFDARRGSAVAWLAAIARNRSLDRLRRAGRRAEVADPEALNRVAQSAAVEPVIDDWEAAQVVRQALRSLPEPLRQVIDLAYFQGLSQSEIAARLGLPLGTVKSRTRLAMLQLRRELASETSHGDMAREGLAKRVGQQL
ncbi:MAG: sigma-70 family RNA polymerase sigma factor [Clostridia bacterium]|nr:sigma-70 family RNA polymerase sigma factor [Clostridia bacterium]